MAIRIISSIPAKEVLKQIICQSCGCTLEYTPIDVNQGKSTEYTGFTYTYRYITCPNCQKQVCL